jgi:hypothetical protein
MSNKIARELEALEALLVIYCRKNHAPGEMCPACNELLVYAASRLAKCPHHPKPACRACPTHCYTPEKRAQVRSVMRSSWPQMLLRHPFLTLKHYL